MAREYIASHPDEANGYFVLGLALHNLDDPEAIDAAERFAELDPDNELAWWLVSITLRQAGEGRDAADAAYKAIKINPDNPVNHIALADALVQLDARLNSERAIRAAKKAIELAPDNPATHACLGGVYFELKRYDRAQQAYENALRLSPDDPEIIHNLAMVALNTGRTPEAADLSAGVLRSRPDLRQSVKPFTNMATRFMAAMGLIGAVMTMASAAVYMFLILAGRRPSPAVGLGLAAAFAIAFPVVMLVVWLRLPAARRSTVWSLVRGNTWSLPFVVVVTVLSLAPALLAITGISALNAFVGSLGCVALVYVAALVWEKTWLKALPAPARCTAWRVTAPCGPGWVVRFSRANFQGRGR